MGIKLPEKFEKKLKDANLLIKYKQPLIVLLRSGRSPLRELLKKRLTSCIREDIILDNGDFKYSVHNGCCECTAALITVFNLMGKTQEKPLNYKIEESVKWLKGQGGEKKYSVIKGQKRGIEYTDFALEAFTIHNEMNDAKKVFEVMKKEKWKTELFPEGGEAKNISEFMYSIGLYLQKLLHEHPENNEKHKKEIKNILKRKEVEHFLNGFKNKKYFEWKQNRLIEGLIGIALLKSLIDKTPKQEMDLVRDAITQLRKDPVIQDPKFLWSMQMNDLVNQTYGWLLYLEAREYFGDQRNIKN